MRAKHNLKPPPRPRLSMSALWKKSIITTQLQEFLVTTTHYQSPCHPTAIVQTLQEFKANFQWPKQSWDHMTQHFPSLKTLTTSWNLMKALSIHRIWSTSMHDFFDPGYISLNYIYIYIYIYISGVTPITKITFLKKTNLLRPAERKVRFISSAEVNCRFSTQWARSVDWGEMKKAKGQLQ